MPDDYIAYAQMPKKQRYKIYRVAEQSIIKQLKEKKKK
jgi:hypothetical protein